MAQLTINYTATADLMTLNKAWLTANVASSTYDSTTQEGTLTLNEGVTEITFRALQSTSQLLSFEFPEGFLTIADNPFYLCSNLKSIHVPASVTLIKGQICTSSVTSLTVASGNTVYNDANGSNVIIETATNKLISASVNCIVPEGVTTIGGGALAGLALGYKALPSTLTTLENYAMNNNNGVSTYYFKNPHPISLTHDQIEMVFGNILIPEIIVPTAEAKAEYEADEVWSNKVGQFVVYDGNARITYESSSDLSNFSSFITDNKLSSTYDSNSGIGTIDFPGGFYIPGSAFSYCSTLTSVDISKFSSIGWNAFYQCSNLATINIDSTFLVICRETFASTAWRNSLPDGIIYKDNICFGYKGTKPSGDLIIPDSIKCIVDTAFQNCTDITNITFGENLLYIASRAFQGISINTLTTNTKLKFFNGSNNFTISTINWNVKTLGEYQAVSLGSSALTTLNFGNQVTYLSEYIFRGATNLTSVTLPDSLKGTSRESFANCSSLTSINLPKKLASVGIACWNGCTNLTTVYYNSQYALNSYMPPNTTTLIYGGDAVITGSGFKGNTNLVSVDFGNITTINDSAFQACTGLTSVTFGDSLTTVGQNAFENCTGLTSVTFGDSLTTIRAYGFRGCTGLTEITLPESLTTIGSFAFQNCSSLTTIYWNAENITSYSSFSSCPISTVVFGNSVQRIPGQAFQNCTTLTSVTFGDSLTTIDFYAFQGCSGLTSITLPNSLTSINNQAFQGCTNLLSVTSLATTPPTLVGSNFTASGDTLYVPDVSLSAYQSAANWSAAFTYYVGITPLVINYKCTTDIMASPTTWLSQNVIAHTWDSTTQEGTLTLDYGVDYIGDNAFKGLGNSLYRNLLSLTIPEGIKSLGNDCIYQCLNLTSVSLPQTLLTCGDYSICGCTNLTNITIPSSLTSIGTNFLRECSNLQSVSFNNNLVSYGQQLCYQCSALTTVYWNTNATQSGGSYRPFTLCNNITTVVIGDDVIDCPTIFKQKASITSLTFGNSLTSIPNQAFLGCTGLTSVTFPNSLTSIGQSAFQNCPNLLSVICLATTPPTLDTGNFSASNDTLYVPSAAKSTYQNTASWRNAFTTIAGIYNLTTSVSGLGSISPSEGPLYEGTDVTLTITPDEGYGIFSVTDNGTPVQVTLSGMTYTISNIAADHAIAVVFKLLYTITTSAGEGGTITPTTEVLEGESFTVTATPNAHYKVSHFIVDGLDVGTIDNYTFQNLDADHTIHVDFEHITHTITATAFEGGAIVPSGTITVNEGENQSFDIIPLEGYGILAVFIDGTQIEPVETYTFTDIEADHTIQALFYPLRVAGFNREQMLDLDYLLQTYIEQLRKKRV